MNCPGRRRAILYSLNGGIHGILFRLTKGVITPLARSDYAINGGDWRQGRGYYAHLPTNLLQADRQTTWDDVSHQTGLSYERSQVTLASITDGLSNTFLIGEKYITSIHYKDGQDPGDAATMYCGDDQELVRWTGIAGAVNDPILKTNNLPRQDGSLVNPEWFGSAHAGSLNMSFCDGSLRSISYSIDGEIFRRLGNRKDGLPVSDGAF